MPQSTILERPTPARARAAIAAIQELTRARFHEDLTLKDLASAATMPTNTLTRVFNRAFGLSPMRWLWAFRTAMAAELMVSAPDWSLTEVAVYCGFNSSAHFSRRFRKQFDASPSEYRDRSLGILAGASARKPSLTDVVAAHNATTARVFGQLEADGKKPARRAREDAAGARVDERTHLA